MENLDEIKAQLQALINEVLITPNEESSLTEIQNRLQTTWRQYQAESEKVRDTLSALPEVQSLENKLIATSIAFNDADHELTTRRAKLPQSAKTKIEPTTTPTAAMDQPGTSKDTANGEDAKIESKKESIAALAKQAETNPDAKAMMAILQQISAQYNEILAGNPSKGAQEEPTLGSTQMAKPAFTEGIHLSKDKIKVDIDVNGPHCVEIGKRSNADEVQQPSIELKMDKFSLPTFGGDLTEWLSFRDQFEDLVHKNPKYTAITKFIQLQKHLKGTALDAINGFKLSAANYEAAWYILTRRYDKPDRIIEEYLKRLDLLPVITIPTTQLLINMVNCTNQILRVLPTLGVDVSTWDTFIKYKITSKLDQTTHKRWLDQVKLRQKVPLNELIEFIEVEASENLPFSNQKQFQRTDQRRLNKPRYQAAAILSTVAKSSSDTAKETDEQAAPRQKPKCQLCKGEHPLFLCRTFRKLSVKDRINKVRTFKLCPRCMRTHGPTECKFGMCPTCGKDHNGMLCFAKEKQQREAGSQVASLHTQEE